MMKSQVCFCGLKQDQESSYQMASDQLGRKYTTQAKVTITNCLYMRFGLPMSYAFSTSLMSKRPHWQWSLGSQSTQMAWDVWKNFWTQQGSTENSRPSQPYLLEDGGITCLAITVQLHGDFTSQPVLAAAATWKFTSPPHIIDVKVLSCSMSIFLRSGMWNVFFSFTVIAVTFGNIIDKSLP